MPITRVLELKIGYSESAIPIPIIRVFRLRFWGFSTFPKPKTNSDNLALTLIVLTTNFLYENLSCFLRTTDEMSIKVILDG